MDELVLEDVMEINSLVDSIPYSKSIDETILTFKEIEKTCNSAMRKLYKKLTKSGVCLT